MKDALRISLHLLNRHVHFAGSLAKKSSLLGAVIGREHRSGKAPAAPASPRPGASCARSAQRLRAFEPNRWHLVVVFDRPEHAEDGADERPGSRAVAVEIELFAD